MFWYLGKIHASCARLSVCASAALRRREVQNVNVLDFRRFVARIVGLALEVWALPEKTMAVLRSFLSEYRASKGFSQEQVAHRAGLSLPTYRRLEAFRSPEGPTAGSLPTLRTVVQVLRALDAEEDFLAALDVALTDTLGAAPEH